MEFSKTTLRLFLLLLLLLSLSLSLSLSLFFVSLSEQPWPANQGFYALFDSLLATWPITCKAKEIFVSLILFLPLVFVVLLILGCSPYLLEFKLIDINISRICSGISRSVSYYEPVDFHFSSCLFCYGENLPNKGNKPPKVA